MTGNICKRLAYQLRSQLNKKWSEGGINMSTLTHLDNEKKASMVDVSDKSISSRSATASGEVHVGEKIHALLSQSLSTSTKKGDVLTVAQIAGIQAAKQTSNVIPLCHPVALSHIGVDVSLMQDEPKVKIVASAKTMARTGVEMEALTAVSVSALTIYDMCKSGGKDITIEKIQLESKSGGQHGDYRRCH